MGFNESDYREVILKCPFCGEVPEPMSEIDTPFGDTIEGGSCGCGAVYVYDRTGRKLGESYTEALVLAYDWDYDAAFFTAEEEYEEAVIRFDIRMRKFLGGEGNFRDKSPKFYFIKKKKKL
jgi:hypothetical protein